MAFRITLIMILLAAGLSLGFVAKLKPVGPGPWLFFSFWLLMPYGMMTFALWRKQRQQYVASREPVIAALVIGVGMLAWQTYSSGIPIPKVPWPS